MPVDTPHPQYEHFSLKWRRMRHVLQGEDTVKLNGPLYLPRLSEQATADYEAYKRRAQFFNATGRTLQSLLGFVFRKDPTVTVPDAMKEFTDDATMTGLTWYDFIKGQVQEVLSAGRTGTLVDFDAAENRPYVVSYRAEQILNWRTTRVGGLMLLSLLVLHECDGEWMDISGVAAGIDGTAPVPDPDAMNSMAAGLKAAGATAAEEPDEYEHEEHEQWRVYKLEMDPEGQPFVTCTLYRRRDAGEKGGNPEYVIVQQVLPTRRGLALDRIPFVFHGPHTSQPDVEKPPLEDLALVNLSLYITSADLENGRHFCGLPTPYACGFDAKGGELRVGSTTAWVTEETGAKVGYLEFQGGGLTTLEKAVDEKKKEMAALGARMLQPEAKKAEAYDTVAIRAAAETSALTTATVSCTQSLSRVLQIVLWWIGTEAKPEDLRDSASVELNTEYTVAALPADQITALTTAYLGGAMDWESFFWKMQQGEYFPPTADPDVVRQNIQDNPPGLPMPAAPVPGAPGAGGGA